MQVKVHENRFTQILLTKMDMLSKNKTNELECGPLPNVMAALPNIGGTLCATPQSLADAH